MLDYAEVTSVHADIALMDAYYDLIESIDQSNRFTLGRVWGILIPLTDQLHPVMFNAMVDALSRGNNLDAMIQYDLVVTTEHVSAIWDILHPQW